MGGTKLALAGTIYIYKAPQNDKGFTKSGQGWRSVGDVNTTTPASTYEMLLNEIIVALDES